jgi:hypothetical protein
MNSSEQRVSRPSTSGLRPTTSCGTAGFKQLLDAALSGDRNRFVDAVENIGLSEVMGHDALGNTLLHLMAGMGDLKMVKLLLRLGLSSDSCNMVGQTAAMVAEDFGNDEVAEYLKRKSEGKQPDPPAVQSESTDPAAAEGNFEQDYLDAVLNYAILIGIDALSEPNLLCIAEEGLSAPLPPGWQERDGIFVNIYSGDTQCAHPNDDVFRQRVLEARCKAAEADAQFKAAEADAQFKAAEADAQFKAAEADAQFKAAEADAQFNAAQADAEDSEVAACAEPCVFPKSSQAFSEAGDGDAVSVYENDFDDAPEAHEEASETQRPMLDESTIQVMMLLQERLKLRTRDMERFGRQTQRAASPDFVPKALPIQGSAAVSRPHASSSKDRVFSGSPDPACALPSLTLKKTTDLDKSEFDRLMRRYMGFSSTQASLSLADRRQRQHVINDAIKGLHAQYNSIATSLRQYLDSKSLARNAAAKDESGTKKRSTKADVLLPAMPGSQQSCAPQLTASPLQASARPCNNPWILPRKFTTLFDPEHMQPSKAKSKYTKLNPQHMEGRCLLSPSVSVSLYPSVSPHRMSDDNDPFAYVLDPRRRRKLMAKQMQRSDRPQCASPWSPELKKSGVWDRNGHLDCNAFLFGDKYIHYNRQLVNQMDLDEELKRKGVQKAEELLWPDPDPYRHIKNRGRKSP